MGKFRWIIQGPGPRFHSIGMKLHALFLAAFLALSGAVPALQSESGAAGATDDFDLDTLIDRISHSKALGFLTKLSLKRDIDGFLKDFRAYHDGREENSLEQLRERYDAMVQKLVVLVQDEDQELVKTIDDGREKLWAMLSDEKKFASL